MPPLRFSLRISGVALFLTCALAAPGLSQLGKKSAIPTPQAQAKAEALIQELFKDEIAKAVKDPAAKTRLALTFLQEGKDTADDAAGRYVLLQQALRFAAQAGDAPTALMAIDEIAQEYGLATGEVFQMKIKALTTASAAVGGEASHQSVVDVALVLLEDALAADDFTDANKLLATADKAAVKLKNVNLVATIRKRSEDVAHLQKAFAQWQPFADRLSKNPTDAEANGEMGKYQAFLKGNWERGLPLLAMGTKGSLQEIAALDLSEPKDPKKVQHLAQQYFEQAQKYQGMMQINLLLRSYHWYEQMLADNGTSGKSSTQLESRMLDIMKRVPPEYRVGEITQELKRCDGQFGPVYAAVFSPDGRRILSGGADGSVRLWDAKTGKELKRLDGHVGRIWTVAFSPDGRRAVSGGYDNAIRLWDLATGREIRKLVGHTDYVRSVVFSHDGHLILSGGDDRMVRLWNADTGKEIRSFPGHEHFVWSVALSHDGKKALSAGLDKTVRLWDVATGSEIKKLEGHKDTVLSVAFFPDGQRALSGSTDKTLKLWDLTTGKDLQTFTGHKGYVYSVALSPDGRRALSTGQDQTLRLWDVHNGDELRTLEGNRDQVWFVTFSPDGRLALTAGQDQTIRLWGGGK